MRKNENMRLAERLLDPSGLPYRWEHTNGGHVRLIVTALGRPHVFITANTPSDPRGAQNFKSTVRQKLRAAGVQI